MSDELLNFLKCLSVNQYKSKDIALAVIWFTGIEDHGYHASMKLICDSMEHALNSRPHITNLRKTLKSDNRTSYRKKDDSFSIKAAHRPVLDDLFFEYINNRPVLKSNSFLPHALFTGTRGYVEKTVDQINASYTHGLYDCCMVMCRRLLETLIIDTYEKRHELAKLKGPDGYFMPLSGLLKVIEDDFNNHTLNIGRNTLNGLKEAKKLGDKSAHNRKWNAKKSDIEKVQDCIRDAAEELLHLAY